MAGQVADPLKAALRREILAARDALSAAARDEKSARITRQLLELEAYRDARCVLAYMSFGSEFDTGTLVMDTLANGKQLCLPRVNRAARQIEICTADDLERDLQDGMWGIREPRADRPHADTGRIDFALVPGVAFTPRCDRLGYGGGFYDRLIAQFAHRPPLIAAAFELQLRERIPLSTRDQRIDVIVTESSIYRRDRQI